MHTPSNLVRLVVIIILYTTRVVLLLYTQYAYYAYYASSSISLPQYAYYVLQEYITSSYIREYNISWTT